MTDLEPPVIGDELLRERVAALGGEAPGGPYAHWLGGAAPDTLLGTSIPGNVHLGPFPMPHDLEVSALPMLDLSWSPPDPVAILNDILAGLGLDPVPAPEPNQSLLVRVFRALSDDPDWPTQELKSITQEEQ